MTTILRLWRKLLRLLGIQCHLTAREATQLLSQRPALHFGFTKLDRYRYADGQIMGITSTNGEAFLPIEFDRRSTKPLRTPEGLVVWAPRKNDLLPPTEDQS